MQRWILDSREALRRIPSSLWIAWLASAVAFAPLFRAWVSDWTQDRLYTHGFLIPPIVAALFLWALRPREGSTIPDRGSSPGALPIGVALTVIGLAAYLAGSATVEPFPSRIGFVLVCTGAAWWIGGRAIGSALSVPLLFLLFAVPIPFALYLALAWPLKMFAGITALALLHLLGAPVTMSGTTIHLPGLAVEIADACSGIRSLTAMLMIGTLAAYLTPGSPLRRTLLCLSTIPFAIVGNVVRVWITSIGAYWFGDWVIRGAAHETIGLVVYVITLAGLFHMARVLKLRT